MGEEAAATSFDGDEARMPTTGEEAAASCAEQDVAAATESEKVRGYQRLTVSPETLLL